MKGRITDRDLETLGELAAANKNLTEVGFRSGEGWARPMDCGAWNGSHHSKTLAKLVEMGFAESNRPPGRAPGHVNGRPGRTYRITDAGIARLEQSNAAKKRERTNDRQARP